MTGRDQKMVEYSILLFCIALPVLNVFFPPLLVEHGVYLSHPMHSVFEAIGACASIFMGLISIRWLSGTKAPRYIFISLGFLAMGIFDLFHAVMTEGNGFVLLHSLALLTGGVLFALVWLPVSEKIIIRAKIIKLFFAFFFSGIALIIILNQALLPKMLSDGQFTATANFINLVAGLLFLLASIRFFMDYRQFGNKGLYLLTVVAVLCGSAGLIFPFSEAWADGWWFWHGLRLAAFLFVLLFAIVSFEKNLKNYTDNLAELNQKHRQMHALFDGIDEVIYVSDPDTYEILHFNDVAQKLWGDNFHDKKCYELLQNRTSPCPFCTNDQILRQKGRAVIWEFQNEVTKDWFRCFDKAIQWNNGKWVRFEMAININDIKKSERRLKKSNAALEMFNKMAVGREKRMIELKDEINQLSREIGKEPPYDTSFAKDG